MINVDALYQTIRDLYRKDYSGWISTDEFNRVLLLAQNDIFEFYLEVAQKTQRISNALRTFIVETYLPTLSGYADFPEDYRYKLEVLFEVVENQPEGCAPLVSLVTANSVNSDKSGLLTESAIKKPDLSRKQFAYEFIGQQIKVHPSNFNGRLYLKYYRHPTTPMRGYIVDTITFEETYDPGSSTQLEWPSEEISQFVDAMLFYKGFQVKESQIVSWLQAKQALLNIN